MSMRSGAVKRERACGSAKFLSTLHSPTCYIRTCAGEEGLFRWGGPGNETTPDRTGPTFQIKVTWTTAPIDVNAKKIVERQPKALMCSRSWCSARRSASSLHIWAGRGGEGCWKGGRRKQGRGGGGPTDAFGCGGTCEGNVGCLRYT